MTYTATVTSKGQVTIPKAIRDFLNLTGTRQVAFVKKNENIIVKPAVDFMSLKESIKGGKYSDKKADQAIGEYISKEYASKNK